MQASSSGRAFSTLSSKIHPQLPLTQRESQQLLTLLTTSFRQQLDLVHPVTSSNRGSARRNGSSRKTTSNASSEPKSSQHSAVQHIDSILTNPLFAIRPQHRGSDPLKAGNVQQALQDPMEWFSRQVAVGAADITTANTCLNILYQNKAVQEKGENNISPKRPGTQVAEWLWSSNAERSKKFLESRSLISRLVPLLIEEKNEAPLWRWFERPPERRVEESSVDLSKVQQFRYHLLYHIVRRKAALSDSLDESILTFLHAVRCVAKEGSLHSSPLIGVGHWLVNHISTLHHPRISISLYDEFVTLTSSSVWTSNGALLESVLHLSHPKNPSYRPGLEYLRNRPMSKKPGLTRRTQMWLCLEVAQASLAEGNNHDAQWALQFAQEQFPELMQKSRVNEPQSTREATGQDIQQLENLVDRLALS